MPEIRKTGQCLDGQVGMTFLEIFGGNYDFLNFREAMNASFSRCKYDYDIDKASITDRCLKAKIS